MSSVAVGTTQDLEKDDEDEDVNEKESIAILSKSSTDRGGFVVHPQNTFCCGIEIRKKPSGAGSFSG